MYDNREHLVIFDADGTVIDAFDAIDRTFSSNGMEIGDLESFQKRRKFFKYLGGLKEFPTNLKKQLGRHSRKKLLSTLTEVYREEASLYPGTAELLNELIATPGIRVGLVTRNITNEPEITLKLLFERHGVDIGELDYMSCIPLREEKTTYFKAARSRFGINPARSFACGDEHKDFIAAINAGMHPFIVSYGFEGHTRLTEKFEIPEEVVSRTPEEFCARIRHAFDLRQAPQSAEMFSLMRSTSAPVRSHA
jgi:phosphoglycolate phosphatase